MKQEWGVKVIEWVKYGGGGGVNGQQIRGGEERFEQILILNAWKSVLLLQETENPHFNDSGIKGNQGPRQLFFNYSSRCLLRHLKDFNRPLGQFFWCYHRDGLEGTSPIHSCLTLIPMQSRTPTGTQLKKMHPS